MATSKYEEENVRSVYNTAIAELQKDYLNEDPHDKFHYIYVGEVVSIKDPLKLGRVKIKVINLFDELTTADIPWFSPCQSFVDGAFSVPNVGDYLETFFERGDIYCGKYLAKAINKNQIPSEALSDYPNNIVFCQTAKGSSITLNKRSGEIRIESSNGSAIIMDGDEVTIHHNKKVRLDAGDEVIIGGGSGYVVTAPAPGTIVTEDGHILTAQLKVRA